MGEGEGGEGKADEIPLTPFIKGEINNPNNPKSPKNPKNLAT